MSTDVIYPTPEAGTTTLSVPFDFIDRDFVRVLKRTSLNRELGKDFDSEEDLLEEGVDYSWVSNGQILLTAPASGVDDYKLERQTDTEPLVTQQPGVLSSRRINLAVRQALDLAEERQSGLESSSELAVRAPEGGEGAILPTTTSRAGKFLVFSTDGLTLLPSEGTTQDEGLAVALRDAAAALSFPSSPEAPYGYVKQAPVRPEWAGAIGDGDVSRAETNKLAIESAAAFAVSEGRPLILEGDYAVNPLVLPSNLVIVGRKGILRGSGANSNEDGTSSNNTPTVSIGSRVEAERISLVWSGHSVDRALAIGSLPCIGEINIERTDGQNTNSLTDNNDVAFLWAGANRGGFIGKLRIKSMDLAAQVQGVFGGEEQARIGEIDIENFMRGVWFDACHDFSFGDAHIRGTSPNLNWRGLGGSHDPDTGPAKNGILYQDCTGITRDGVLRGGDSWSHFERIGGHNGINANGKLMLPDGEERYPGQYTLGETRAKDHGGSAFKCNTSVTTNFIRGLQKGDVYSVNGGIDRGVNDNIDTVRMQHTEGFSIGKIVTQPTNIATGETANYGLLMTNCRRGVVDHVGVNRPRSGCIRMHSGDGPVQDVTVQSHVSSFAQGDAVIMDFQTGDVSGVQILNGSVRNSVGTGYNIQIARVREGCRVEGVASSNGTNKNVQNGSNLPGATSPYGEANFVDDIVTVPG